MVLNPSADNYKRRQTSDFSLTLAKFTHGLKFENLSRRVVEHTLSIVRDTLGAMLAGATLPEIRNLAELADALGGPGKASLMSQKQTASPHFAAFVNGTGAVSLELDEGNQYAVNHPAVHIFPAVLALSQEHRKSGASLLAAFVAGYEVAVRVGRATHLREPVHPFGTHTIVGTAAAASRLLGLDVEQTAGALELAAGMSVASSQTAANDGASVRNLITGMTNQNGLLAPMLLLSGFTGERGALDVIFGQILGDAFQTDEAADDLGSEFYILRNYFKLHACSRWNHAPIEATAALCRKQAIRAEDVARITVWTYDPATRLSWNQPTNGYAAKHSIPFNVAVRLVRGTNNLASYSDNVVSDPIVQAVAARVKVREDPAYTAMLPDLRPARVEIELFNGTRMETMVERPRGGFDCPTTREELKDKFHQLAGQVLPAHLIAELDKHLTHLPEIEDVTELSPILQGGHN